MSVLIRGMEMPTRCGRCDMRIKEADGDIDYHYECCITAARIDNLGEKMEDCPLIPVPEHGRCIDADALEDELGQFCDDNWVYNTIRHMPTIIPAEEGET